MSDVSYSVKEARAQLGSLVRQVAHSHGRVAITDDDQTGRALSRNPTPTGYAAGGMADNSLS